MSFFPTRIEQVQAPSNEAMNTYLDLLGKAPNPAKDYGNLIINTMNQYRSADEADKLANAIDILRKGMEAGQSYEDASKGVEARISGSKPFQERADAIRDSVLKDQRFKFDVMNADRSYALEQAGLGLRQREFDLREQELARQLEADDLVAKFLQNRAVNGAEASPGFIQGIQSRLDNNPYAHKVLMDAVIKSGDDISPANMEYVNQDYSTKLNDANKAAYEYLKKFNDLKREVTKDGLITDEVEAAINSGDILSVSSKIADAYGLEGSKKRDLMHEYAKVYNRVGSDPKFRDLHRSQLLSAMTRSINPDPGWFGSYIDESALRSYLQGGGQSAIEAQKLYKDLTPYMEILNKNPNFFEDAGSEYRAKLDKALLSYQQGLSDHDSYLKTLAKIQEQYKARLDNFNAIKEAFTPREDGITALTQISNPPKK